MTQPTDSSWARTSAVLSCDRQPGMASSLSRVPPVWPSPRPDSWGTAAPSAASSGHSTSETLSPTPPGRMLVDARAGQPGQVHDLPGGDDGAGQAGQLTGRHALEVDGHQPGRHLLVGHGAGHVGIYEPADLVVGELAAVPLGADQVDGVEMAGRAKWPVGWPGAVIVGRRPWWSGPAARARPVPAGPPARPGRTRPAAGRPALAARPPGRRRRAEPGPPCSISSWRQRPQGASGRPSAAVTLTATSRARPRATRADTRPHSAHRVRPKEAFSTLQPVTTWPSSHRPAAPTLRPE